MTHLVDGLTYRKTSSEVCRALIIPIHFLNRNSGPLMGKTSYPILFIGNEAGE